MSKINDESVDIQSEAWISVAYNKNCHLSLMKSFVKRPPGATIPDYIYVHMFMLVNTKAAFT